MISTFIEPLSIFAIFIISFILIRKNFDLALYLLLLLSVLLHKELFSFYIWDLLPIRIFMFSILCSFSIDLVLQSVNNEKRKLIVARYFKSVPVVLLFGMWFVNGLSLYFSLNLKASLLLYGFFTCVVVLFILIFERLGKDASAALKYLKTYVFIVFGLTIFGYFQYYLYTTTGKIIGALWNIPNNIPRIGATFWDINHYAALLAALLPISSVFILIEKKIALRIVYAFVSVSLLISLLLTNSRSAWIMIAVSFVIFALALLNNFFGKKGIVTLLLFFAVITCGAGAAYSQKDGAFRKYIRDYFHYRVDSFDSHVLLLQGSFEIFQEYPILGGGYGGFFEHFSKTDVGLNFFGRDPAAFTTRVPAHTIWGEVLSGSGVLGFGLFLLFVCLVLGTLLYAAHVAKNTDSFLMLTAMYSVLIGWLVAGVFYSYNSEFFWIIWALFFSFGAANADLNGNFTKVVDYLYAAKNLSKIAILLISAVLIFWSLGTNHLIPWDEAIYAKIAKNMVTTGNFITQRWQTTNIWYEKPPLYMWLEAIFMSVLGFTSLAARLPSAIFGFLTLVVVYKLAAKLFNKTAAFISVLSLATTVHFLYYSRNGMLDVTTTFFVTLAVYLYYRSKEKLKTSTFIYLGMAIGFATMTKGVVGLLPLPLIVMFEIFSKNRFKVSNYFLILLSFGAIALPWHIEMYRQFGQPFLNNYIGYHVLDRATNAIEDKGNPLWWYLIVMKVSLRIWAISLIGALPFAFVQLFKKDVVSSSLELASPERERGASKILPVLIWFLFVLVLFSVSKSKLVWYIIPLYPAVAIMNGYFLDWVLSTVLNYFPQSYYRVLKMLALYILVLFSLTYLILNKELVYTSDLTGSQARLMQAREKISKKVTGPDSTVYLDRIELPLALFYLDSPFKVIDFSAKSVDRVPRVDDNQALVLLTKKGRYSDQVAGYLYAPTVVAEDGDWILWYLPPRDSTPKL